MPNGKLGIINDIVRLTSLSFISALFGIVLGPEARASDKNIYFSGGIVSSRISVDAENMPDFTTGDGEESGAGTVFELGLRSTRPYLGLQISSNNFSSFATSVLGLDSMRYTKFQLTAGYDFPLGDSSFSISPELSLGRISMRFRESPLFNSAEGEALEEERDSDGWGAGLQARWYLGNTARLNFSYAWFQTSSVEQRDSTVTLEFHL